MNRLAEMMARYQQNKLMPKLIQNRLSALRMPPGRILGEFGVVPHPNGAVSTELSATVTDPRLNNGFPTNIPTLVRGNEVLRDLIMSGQLKDSSFDNEVIRTAIERALSREKDGMTWPAYMTIEDAVNAAQRRSQRKGQ